MVMHETENRLLTQDEFEEFWNMAREPRKTDDETTTITTETAEKSPPRKAVQLPSYATMDEKHGIVHVDMDAAMRSMLTELNVRQSPLKDNERGEQGRRYFDQYWGAVAIEFIKLDIQQAVRSAGEWPGNGALAIMFSNAPQWKLSAAPRGRGEQAAIQGREARVLYQQLRGFIPV